jgi:nucleoside-diphosphate-sugar epimerase
VDRRSPDQSMDVIPATIAVTGVAGLLAQRLLPHLDAMDGVGRIVGLDLREPARRVPRFEFHRVDIASSDLTAVLDGVDTIVHLAGVVAGTPDRTRLAHVDIEGTRRVLEAAAGARHIVSVSSAAVYGAWPNNALPLTEDAPLRPNPGFVPALHDAENERRLAEWGEKRRTSSPATATTLRLAPVVGPGAHGLFARAALGRPPVAVRGSTRPVQVVHVEDAASALALAVERNLDGVFNVAADGWLSDAHVRAVVGSGPPALPEEIARRVLQVLWASGLGDAPPELLPYLVHPWVVANDRLRAQGWAPAHSNLDAIGASLPLAPIVSGTRRAAIAAAAVAATAGTAATGLGAARLARRVRVRRARP